MDWKNGASGHKFITSFSGGKDSVLALYKSMKVGEAIGLIIMLEEEGGNVPDLMDCLQS